MPIFSSSSFEGSSATERPRPTRSPVARTSRRRQRVVLMSATTDAARLSAYFDGTGAKHAPPPPHVHIPGRTYPVEERFVDQYVGGGERRRRTPAGGRRLRPGIETVARTPPTAWITPRSRRSFVVCARRRPRRATRATARCWFFYPARGAARAESPELRSLRGASLVPLHGQLTPKEQQRAFAPPPAGARKIVLATNVAETSLTIPDVTYVVDTGRAKRLTHDPATRFSALREGGAARRARHSGKAARVASVRACACACTRGRRRRRWRPWIRRSCTRRRWNRR